MKKAICFIVFLVLITAVVFAKASADKAVQPKTYKVGDVGPAGGLVFYDKGNFSDGWRYMEAAPAETEFVARWGTYSGSDTDYVGYAVPGMEDEGEEEMGSGKQNTQLIVAKLRQLNETGRAAQVCTSLNVNGFSDWFLPSIEELIFMYWNLQQKGLGDFSSNVYWSSTQYDANYAWVQEFGNGDYHGYRKDTEFSVRAVRVF